MTWFRCLDGQGYNSSVVLFPAVQFSAQIVQHSYNNLLDSQLYQVNQVDPQYQVVPVDIKGIKLIYHFYQSLLSTLSQVEQFSWSRHSAIGYKKWLMESVVNISRQSGSISVLCPGPLTGHFPTILWDYAPWPTIISRSVQSIAPARIHTSEIVF